MESILEHIFKNKHLPDIPEERMIPITDQYPYFPNGHIWLAKKYAATTPEKYQRYLEKANIYAGERYILQQYLDAKNEPPLPSITPPEIDEMAATPENTIPANEPAEEAVPEEILQENEMKENEITQQQETGTGEPEEKETTEENILEARISEKLEQELSSLSTTPEEELIKPLYAEDYFASQGIKLPEKIDDTKKPTSEQLRSFTDWLRATRRPRGSRDPDNPDENSEASYTLPPEGVVTSEVKKMASDSIASNETIITEAMANVRILQGQYDKAIAIYEKLSLLNPEKSDYFAQKIQKLKK